MWNFVSIIQSAMGLKRSCPNCKRVQVVRSDQRDKTVNCKYCGHEVPPPKKKYTS